MKKIISSILAIVLTVGVVSGTAFALFSDTATVSGISIAAGNADITISGNGTDFDDNAADIGVDITNIYPGMTFSDSFWIKNQSLSEIGLNITAQLTAAPGDWAALSPWLYLKIDDAANPANTTNWKTLADWNTSAVTFPSNPLAFNTTREYIANFKVDPAATNADIAGKGLTDVTFVITGTQTP